MSVLIETSKKGGRPGPIKLLGRNQDSIIELENNRTKQNQSMINCYAEDNSDISFLNKKTNAFETNSCNNSDVYEIRSKPPLPRKSPAPNTFEKK